MRRPLWILKATVLLAAGIAAVVVFLSRQTLDRAEKWVTMGGVLISALIGVAGLMLAWRNQRGGSLRAGQTVAASTVGGEILQVRGVRGNVRAVPASAGSVPEPQSAPDPTPAQPQPSASGQSVSGTRSSGSVRQIDDIGGDVDIR